MSTTFKQIKDTQVQVNEAGVVTYLDNRPVKSYSSPTGNLYSIKFGKTRRLVRAAKLVLNAFRNVSLSDQTRIQYRDENPGNASLANLNTEFVVEHKNAPIQASKVFKFNDQGELVATYHSAYAAAKANDIAYCIVSKVARSGQFWRGAFYRYSDQFDRADLAKTTSARHRHVRLVRSTKSNTLYQYDLQGNYLRSFHTPADAQAFLNVTDISHIYKVIRGVRANAFGYIWSRKRHSNVIRFKKTQYNIIRKDTAGNVVDKAFGFHEAAAKFNLSLSNLYLRVSNHDTGSGQYLYEKEQLHKI